MISRRKVDVLWLVEHVAREMDVACAVKAKTADRGVEVVIRNMYYHAEQNLVEFDPHVVVHPFFYHLKDALATEDYVAAWPNATHFNIAWEQIHYKAHLKIKAPADDFTRRNVVHHAWGDFSRSFLLEAGVAVENIFLNGQPAYQLYKDPYKSFYKDRQWLASKYDIPAEKRWIFVPENYRWAFLGNKINYFKKLGGDEQEMLELRDFCVSSLRRVLAWCNRIAEMEGVLVIFRPRPSLNSAILADFFAENVGKASAGLKFIKTESVREWILASDAVVSTYSTTLIEAAVAGKPFAMLEPVEIPDSLFYEWYRHAPRIRRLEHLMAFCQELGEVNSNSALRDWAEKEMLGRGDPIENLAGFLRGLAARGSANRTPQPADIAIASKKSKKYFNETTHENDVFSEEDVRLWTEDWRRVMNDGAADPIRAENREDLLISIIVCTFNRADFLQKCLESLVSQETSWSREIIVIDNNSSDGTKIVVDDYRARFPQVRYFFEANQGLSHARNRGCAEARGRYLVYIDDDGRVDPGYIAKLGQLLTEYRPDILGGPVLPIYDTNKPRWFKDSYEIRKFAPVSGFSTTCRVSGGNFTIRKELLHSLGGFDVNLGMKGTELGLGEERAVLNSYRQRTPSDAQKVYYSTQLHLLHNVPAYKMKRRYMARRSFQAGRIMFRIKKKDPATVFRRMRSLVPDTFRLMRVAVKRDGIIKADYSSVLFETSTRLGNIAELLANGWRPVLKPHLRVIYGRLRFNAKRMKLGRFVAWFEHKMGIKWS